MEMAVWILFCMFTSIGLVQCGFWIMESIKAPQVIRRGYHVIPLFDYPEEIEAQIRFALSQVKRSGLNGELVLLVDMGLGRECQQICENLIRETGGVFLCDANELEGTIRELDNLQFERNVVE